MTDAVTGRLTVERLFAAPPINPIPPSRLRFSPDGNHLAWLQAAVDQPGRLELWSTPTTAPRPKCLLDTRALETGRVSAADRERQERQRQFTAGVSTFEWLADGEHLLVPLAGQTLLLRLDGSHTALALPRGEIGDLRASPLGTYLTYVADNDLFVFRRDTGEEIRITHDGSECVSNGLAEFIAQEEMHRFEGYWWAPDERRLIFTRVDSSTIPVSHRLEVVADDVTAIAQRYAFAGGPNARVALLEFDLRTGTTTALDIGLGETDYLARVSFVGDVLTVQVQNRAQNRLELRGEDEKGFCTWLVETSDTWINLHDNLRAMADGRYVWTSERDGLARLYVARIDASQPPVPVTPDDLHVTAVLGSHGSTVWLQGWREQPTERHVYRVQVPSGSLTCLTTGSRWNDATVHPESGQLARVVSDFTTPPYLLLASGGGESTLARVAADHPCHSIERVPAVFGTLAAADGQTLHWRMTAPLAVHRGSGGRHPVIVYVYGGPGAQRVCNAWPPMLVHLLSHAGYGVLELDNRGSANRGRTFEAPIFHHMGEVEVADQVTALSVLERFPWADADRIGVHGHSYGGYMTLMCLCKAGDRFKAGVAGAPVADWRLYDTHYTERYLGNPAEDLTPYEMSSVLPCLERLARPLLLVHGMADDNVLFTHSTRLMRELQRLGKPFELMTYPGSRHALQEKDVSLHRLHHLLDFFRPSPVSVEVRPATVDDAGTLVEFNLAMASETEDRPLDAQRLAAGIRHALMHPEEARYLLASLNGEAVGALMLTFEWSDWRAGRFWWIQSVYVAPSHRRRGVYRALHERVKAMVRADPLACGIRLYVERENGIAQATYRSLGMDETHYRLYEEDFTATD